MNTEVLPEIGDEYPLHPPLKCYEIEALSAFHHRPKKKGEWTYICRYQDRMCRRFKSRYVTINLEHQRRVWRGIKAHYTIYPVSPFVKLLHAIALLAVSAMVCWAWGY